MSRETWSPELNLKPSEKAPNTPEESEWIPRAYNYPPITDLAMPKPVVGDSAAEDAVRSRKLEETLASFRVQAQVVHGISSPHAASAPFLFSVRMASTAQRCRRVYRYNRHPPSPKGV